MTGPAGEPVTQAGGHPEFLTTTLLFNNMLAEGITEPAKPVQAVKDLVFYLPLGFLGNPTVTAKCPASLVEVETNVSGCPPSSRVGTILPMILNNVFADTPDPTHEFGIYNVVPEKGYAAEFAFAENGYTFFLYASVVRRNGSYMLRIATPGLPQIAYMTGVVATFYGDIQEHFVSGGEEFTFDRGNFLTLPSDCGESAQAREATVAANTWEDPDPALPMTASVPALPVLGGCEHLRFTPSESVQPETTQMNAPAGDEIGLEVPQAPDSAAILGTPPLRDVAIALPAGSTISPAGANGLQACQESGSHGINIEGPEAEVVGADGLEHLAGGHCPSASEVASVTASTPLLGEPLTGHVFVAAPKCGGAGQSPCTSKDAENGNLFGLYLELEGPNTGVVIKVKGEASVEPGSGKITTIFTENPQFPVSKLVASLKRGPRSPVVNPMACGQAVSHATFTSWGQEPGSLPEEASDVFSVDWDGAGGGCPASLPFAPSLAMGTVAQTAGTTSPFTLMLTREDHEENIASLSTTLPQGMLAYLSNFERCPEPQASEDSLSACPAGSQIGTTTVSVGSGSEPYVVNGKVFITEPYKGAPFGLSVVVPAVAGPFNLGNVLVRAALQIDPHTLQVTAVSDELPPELDGVPLRMRTLSLTLGANREFIVNPTSCAPASITATVYSRTPGKSENVANSFAASNCDDLAFKPVVSASTEALSTKANGTGVHLKIAYPLGGQANIAKLAVGFPSLLPVRLATLQQACRAGTFEANPANCPSASDVGSAVARSPLIANPLVGPAYLVSYGSQKFPDVVFVLQGEGIKVEVVGESFVSSSGALKVTFGAVPDARISTFETTLPAGPFSGFTSTKSSTQAVGSQCGENLLAPVAMVAHNGATLTQTVKMEITGCKTKLGVSIVKAKATSKGLVLSVKTSERGRLTVSGRGLKTFLKKNVSAGTHKVTLAFTKAGKTAAKAHKKIEVTVGLVVGKQKASKHRKIVL